MMWVRGFIVHLHLDLGMIRNTAVSLFNKLVLFFIKSPPLFRGVSLNRIPLKRQSIYWPYHTTSFNEVLWVNVYKVKPDLKWGYQPGLLMHPEGFL